VSGNMICVILNETAAALTSFGIHVRRRSG
jgi:hypothetical protein